MKLKFFYGLVVTLLIVGCVEKQPAPCEQGGRGQGFRPYTCPYEGAASVPGMISGPIVRVFPESFAEDMEQGSAVNVQDKTRGTMHVHLGPEWFLERQGLDLKPGDEVTIKGRYYHSDGKERMIAAEVIRRDQILKLRDINGKPAW
jgi:hypothetical protein